MFHRRFNPESTKNHLPLHAMRSYVRGLLQKGLLWCAYACLLNHSMTQWHFPTSLFRACLHVLSKALLHASQRRTKSWNDFPTQPGTLISKLLNVAVSYQLCCHVVAKHRNYLQLESVASLSLSPKLFSCTLRHCPNHPKMNTRKWIPQQRRATCKAPCPAQG